MTHPMPIIALREIGSEVTATTLFTPERGVGDETRHGQHIAEGPIDRRRSGRGLEAGARGDEICAAAEESDVLPHQVADLIHR